VSPTTVFTTSPSQQARAQQAILSGALDALPGITIPANHPAVLAGFREYRRAAEAATERPRVDVRFDALRLEVADALDLPLADGVVDEILTSPPYGLEKPYKGQADLAIGWELFMRDWLKEAFRVLREPGRLVINVPFDTTKGGYRDTWPQASTAAKDAGFKYRTAILWNKANSTKGNLSLGSQEAADAPHPIAEVEVIGLFFKEAWKLGGDRPSDMTHDEWQAWGDGVWNIPGESRPWEGHPAPFPEELVLRLIRYLTRVGDTVHDPFSGSGTTPLVGLQLGRQVIGFDIVEEYVESAKRRIAAWDEERSRP
jgi:site-specific DNA-methyltransferase (adenine-specific)